MEFASGIVDAEAAAERIERGRCAREFASRQRDGIDNREAVERRSVNQGQFRIEKLEVEFRVMDDQVAVTQEGNEIFRHVGETRLRAEKFGAKPMDPESFLGHVALGIDIGLVAAARRNPVDQLEAADFHDAVAGSGVETGGFRVEDDFPHARGGSLPCLVRTPPPTAPPASGTGFPR